MIAQAVPAESEARAGTLAALPVLIGVVPFGLLLGALAAQQGLSPLEMALMSALVFAGSAQFVAVEMWVEPAPVLLLAATTAMINLRHVLMGAAFARPLAGWPRPAAYAGLFAMADETWALSLRRARQVPLTPTFYGTLVALFMGTYVGSTTLGALLGMTLRDPARYGFDFAFVAVFIGLLCGLWRGRASLAPWAASAAVAAVASKLLPGPWYIAAGGVAGMVVAALTAPAEVRR